MRQESLKPIHWHEVLHQVAVDLAKNLGLVETWIFPTKNNQ